MVGKKYNWQGFEFVPSGCLLEQVVDLSQDMGFAYERSTKYYKDFHTHDRLMLIFPRGTTTMDVRTQNPSRTFSVDYETVLYIPKNLSHDDESTSSIYDTMAFYPSDTLLERTIQKFELTDKHVQQIKTECLKLRRTELIENIAQAYFTERVVWNKSKKGFDTEATTLLGRRLLEEVLLATFFPNKNRTQPSELEIDETDPVAVRALRHIEANLFEPLDLTDIAKISYASVSTLLRHFKSDVGITPYLYIKNRRLEEALRLLKSGQYPVGDVALLVGYENFGAFSEAFKDKYGRSPSEVKGKAVSSNK